MVISSKRIFIYGNFVDRAAHALGLPPPPNQPTVALEILREFSALEFVGRVYVLSPGRNWQPVSPMGVREYDWFRKYRDILQHKKTTANKLLFETQERDFWEVLYLREESDESGAYMAAALRHD
jgi:hypothetical protein